MLDLTNGPSKFVIDQVDSEPYFSVVIATYNRFSFVCEAIESVINQTFKDFEIIVCDDGSTDNSYDGIKRIYEDRVKLIRTPHLGPAGARNAAIMCASGKFIACLDSDDLWAPWTLEYAYEVTRTVHGPLIAYLVPTYVPLNVKIPNFLRIELNIQVYESYLDTPPRTVCGAGMIVAASTDVIKHIGGFSEVMQNGEDRDLALRLGRRAKVVIVDSPNLLLCREHGSQMTKSFDGAIQGWFTIEDNYRKGVYGDVKNDIQLACKILQHFMSWALDLPELDGRWASGLRFYKAVWRSGILSNLYCRRRGCGCPARAVFSRKDNAMRAWYYFILKYPIFLILIMLSRQGLKMAKVMSTRIQRLIIY